MPVNKTKKKNAKNNLSKTKYLILNTLLPYKINVNKISNIKLIFTIILPAIKLTGIKNINKFK